MKISVIQADTEWENKAVNFRKLNELISPLSGKSDLVILPEMFNTWFSMNACLPGEPPETAGIQFQRHQDQPLCLQ